jgi:iron complex transport system ATP-binding protein
VSVLSARGLCMQLGGKTVVQDLSLDLRAGEWAALVGPNGAGKTTLLHGLAGLRAASAGGVQLQGKPLAAWPVRGRAQHLAWLAQVTEAEGDIAVQDVVMLGRLPHQGWLAGATAADHAAVQSAMQETACAHLASRRLSDVSGGERQRVLLARALAVGAGVLLLDEPTTHLDAPHQRDLLRCLRKRAHAGVAVLAVLHDLNLALMADRVWVLDSGRLVADGAPESPALQAALVQVFGGAFSIQPVATAAGERLAIVPNL